jgi:hypothetical protein
MFANMGEKESLIFYYNMNSKWITEEYTVCLTKVTKMG